MHATMFCDESIDWEYAVRAREVSQPAVEFERPSLARYRTQARFGSRPRKCNASFHGAHRRRLKRA